AITSPVDGLIVGNVFPEAASTHLLLINSFAADIFTFGSITVVAVAMVFLLAEANWVKASLYPLAPPRNIPIHPIANLDFLSVFSRICSGRLLRRAPFPNT